MFKGPFLSYMLQFKRKVCIDTENGFKIHFTHLTSKELSNYCQIILRQQLVIATGGLRSARTISALPSPFLPQETLR